MKNIKFAMMALLLLITSNLSAQTFKESFSAEGRKNWESEFTLRGSMGIFTGGFDVTGGVRIDDMQQGVNILRMSDGSVVKVVIK